MHICYHDTSLRVQDAKRNSTAQCFITGGRNLQSLVSVDGFGTVAKQVHVRFKPGGFSSLLGVPEGELRNTYFAITDLLGSEGNALQDRLNNSISTQERLSIIDSFFLKEMKARSKQPDIGNILAALNLILKSKGQLSVGAISRDLNVSSRTLERQSLKHFGLSPKELSRIARFKAALNALVMAKNRVDWAELVQAFGYFDQSHFINEFKSATTYTPEELLRLLGRNVVRYVSGLVLVKPDEILTQSARDLIHQTLESGAGNSGLI